VDVVLGGEFQELADVGEVGAELAALFGELLVRGAVGQAVDEVDEELVEDLERLGRERLADLLALDADDGLFLQHAVADVPEEQRRGVEAVLDELRSRGEPSFWSRPRLRWGW
jgi:hypothetical protein